MLATMMRARGQWALFAVDAVIRFALLGVTVPHLLIGLITHEAARWRAG